MQEQEKPSLHAYSLLDVIGVIFRWRKAIAIGTVSITVGAAIISLILPVYYTAYATFTPANEEKELFETTASNNNSLYGDDDAVDRALIFGQSSNLIGYMVQTFNLAEEYNIDASTPKGQDRVSKRFLKLYDIKKNEHSGIEVSIQDQSPEKAKMMVDSLVGRIAILYKAATQNNKNLLLNTYRDAIQQKQNQLKTLSDSLANLRQYYQIYDVEKQGEALSSLIVQIQSNLINNRSKLAAYQKTGKRDSIINISARIQGLESQLKSLQSTDDSTRSAANLPLFNQGKEKILSLELQIEELNESLSEMVQQESYFKAKAQSQAATIITLEAAQIPKVKSYPIRSFIVIAAAFLGLFFSVLGALLFDMYKRVDWKKVLEDGQ